MKDNLRKNIRLKVTSAFYLLAALCLCTNIACDFDVPDKFEMPVWNLDLKIPLVNAKYEMSDISNPDAGIFPTPDSVGFQIVQSGQMDPQVLPNLPTLPMGLDAEISSGEFPGVSVDVALPDIDVEIKIDLQQLASGISLLDTTDQYVAGIKISDYTPFTLPADEPKVMEAEMYDQTIVNVYNVFIGTLTEILTQNINLQLSNIPLPPMIASVDTLELGTGSTYITGFTNSMPTDLANIYSYMVTGTESLDDTIANHDSFPSLSYGESYRDTTDLSESGLATFLQVATNFQLQSAGSEFVTIPAGSLYVDFKILFQIVAPDSIDITTANYSLSDVIEMPSLDFPEMDMSESGISKMEIINCILRDVGALYNENRVKITGLESSFPFDLKFLINFKNFSPENTGRDSVKIDTTLAKGLIVDKVFDMRGYSIESPDPNSPLNSFDLDFDVGFIEQKTSIPLDGSSLGGFNMRMEMELLSFSALTADLYMLLPTDSTVQEFPPGFTGAVPTEALFEITMKSQIPLPVRMKLDFTGYNSLGEPTYVTIDIDTMASVESNATPFDTALTIIGLSRHGTRITIFDDVSDSLPSYDDLRVPCDTCTSIIGLLGSNPARMIIDPEVKVEGKGTLVENKAIQGGFKVTIPFALQLQPMTFMGGVPTEVEEFEHDTRYKIRNSLIESNMVTDMINSFPFSAEMAILLSNYSMFPVDTSKEMLSLYLDTLATMGYADSTMDSIYITRKCSDLSPDSNRIYIYKVMTDYSECIDYLPYLVKTNGSGVDTVIAYVDTLFKFLLPSPEELYGADDSTGFPEGMVALPGSGTYFSTIDTNKIFLLTDYGNHFIMPRFYIPGTNGKGVFLSKYDYLEMNSFLTFSLSSGGVFGTAKNELVIIYPNGGETLYTNQSYEIKWKTYGKSVEKVDLHYANAESDPDSIDVNIEGDWSLIVRGINNSGSYLWNPSGIVETDSLRLRIISSDGSARDMNGWYIKIRNSSRSMNQNKPMTKMISSRK